ncbi:MAG: hypothetical protein H0V72_26460 [Bradyrhizobium sp.]|nr:hypothetical protein [Bradyrhizobium sp.]
MRLNIVLALPLIVLAWLPLIASGAANAQSGPPGFLSPSKNIACAYFDYDKQNTLRCDIMEATVTVRRPADCDLEWGKAFEMNAKGGAVRLCYGDTVMDPKMPVLAYGEVWQRGGFTCKSEQAGVTCFNADRRGFSLARAKQELF